MALPIVAVVGRPNVGKSTFVNRIAQADEAIVHEMRGVTRDRSYHIADWNGVPFKLIDTGGIEMGDDDAFQSSIRTQAFAGVNEADVIVFIVDGRTGINADDEEVARVLRKTSKPVYLVVNKMDNPDTMDQVWEFYQLGLGDPWSVSSLHGSGTGDLLDAVVEDLKKVETADDEEEDGGGINIAIIGRPNAGKSSLTNRLTSDDRSIVSNVAGTTRDAIDTVIEHDGQRYTIVDTAGLRQKSKIDEDVEYYGFVRAMRAIDRADVAILVIDGSIGLTDQDQRVAGFAADRQCAVVNHDGRPADELQNVQERKQQAALLAEAHFYGFHSAAARAPADEARQQHHGAADDMPEQNGRKALCHTQRRKGGAGQDLGQRDARAEPDQAVLKGRGLFHSTKSPFSANMWFIGPEPWPRSSIAASAPEMYAFARSTDVSRS